MNKSESIRKLEEIGLNTLDYYITKDKTEALHYLAKHQEDLVSMRTERGSEYACPFYYKIPGKEMIANAKKHLDEGYTLIFSPSLDVKGCLAFGTVGIGDREDVIEIVLGEGKVRELDTHPEKKTISVPKGRLMAVGFKEFPGKAQLINTVYQKAKDAAYDLGTCILEFSYYSYPVGMKNHNDIWWEVRSYS